MLESLVKAYVEDRYIKEPVPSLVPQLIKYWKDAGYKLIGNSKIGFMVYKLQGDSLVISDMYVLPEKRKSHWCLDMFNYLVKTQAGSARVIIGFSEHGGHKNHELGRIAMKSVGFTPCYELKDKTVYMRGIV